MTFKNWDKTDVKLDNGEIITGIAPVIISASRSTDIPAFHAKWFFNRLNAGYVKWINPFNRVPQYVSFEKTRVIVFWTKNAEPILSHLKLLDSKNINYYFQFTLNDYEKEGLEPSIPKLESRISTFKKLSEMIGKEKVIWRFDPLILTDKISVENLIDKINRIGNEIHNYTNKLVISFVDIESYSKVKRNLTKSGINYIDFDKDSMEQIAEAINKINKEWDLEIATCAENLNLDPYGIKHNKCIDDDLMVKIFKNDKELMSFLGAKNQSNNVDLSSFGGGLDSEIPRVYLKDTGQRKQCGCIVSKDIGQYNTCGHLCTYCYANYSEKVVQKNLKEQLSQNGESILGD